MSKLAAKPKKDAQSNGRPAGVSAGVPEVCIAVAHIALRRSTVSPPIVQVTCLEAFMPGRMPTKPLRSGVLDLHVLNE